MPELPEVETIRIRLKPLLIGKRVKSIDVLVKKQFIGDPRKLTGQEFTDITRKGKLLTLVFGNKRYLAIHLKLTGQLLYADDRNHPVFKNEIPRTGTDTMPAKATRIIVYFTDNSVLYFNDQRKFGWMRLSDTPTETEAVDLLSPKFTLDYFAKAVKKSKKPIKTVLLDQDKFTGIGNIYANDALWHAKIHPLKPAKTLTDVEIGELYKAIKLTIADGLKYNGTSDEFYVLPDSLKGKYQDHVKVYGREGLPCLRCGTKIKRIKHGGRSSFFCPKCQPL